MSDSRRLWINRQFAICDRPCYVLEAQATPAEYEEWCPVSEVLEVKIDRAEILAQLHAREAEVQTVKQANQILADELTKTVALLGEARAAAHDQRLQRVRERWQVLRSTFSIPREVERLLNEVLL